MPDSSPTKAELDRARRCLEGNPASCSKPDDEADGGWSCAACGLTDRDPE